MTPNTPSSIQKSIARFLSSYFTGTGRQVFNYFDDKKASNVDVLVFENSPQQGTVSYATVGLSDHPLALKGRNPGFGVEFLGACGD